MAGPEPLSSGVAFTSWLIRPRRPPTSFSRPPPQHRQHTRRRVAAEAVRGGYPPVKRPGGTTARGCASNAGFEMIGPARVFAVTSIIGPGKLSPAPPGVRTMETALSMTLVCSKGTRKRVRSTYSARARRFHRPCSTSAARRSAHRGALCFNIPDVQMLLMFPTSRNTAPGTNGRRPLSAQAVRPIASTRRARLSQMLTTTGRVRVQWAKRRG